MKPTKVDKNRTTLLSVCECCCMFIIWVLIAARATYLLPGSFGRGVKLGSESSSGAGAGGVWKSENRGTGNLEIWRSGDLKIQKCGVQQIEKIQILKIQIRSAPKKMSARSGLVGNKTGGSGLGPSEAVFSMDRNKKKHVILHIFLDGPMGPINPVWALAAIHPSWINRLS